MKATVIVLLALTSCSPAPPPHHATAPEPAQIEVAPPLPSKVEIPKAPVPHAAPSMDQRLEKLQGQFDWLSKRLPPEPTAE
jgi:hypothetical protein